MKRKRVVIVTGNQRVAQAIFSDVKAVFNNDVDIDIVYPSQIASLDAVEADAFLVTRWYNIGGLTDKVSSKSKVVRTTRTISESGYKKITKIPPGTNVLVVNDSEQSTSGVIELLMDLHLDGLTYVPYTAGHYDPSLKIAITPGESRYVPSYIENIIDIGNRHIDISTVLALCNVMEVNISEIAGPLMNYFNMLLCRDVISRQYRDTLSKSMYMNSILKHMEQGVLLTAPDGRIILSNGKMNELLRMQITENRDYVSAVFPEGTAARIANMDNDTLALNVNGREMLINHETLNFGDTINHNLYFFNDVTYIRRLERKSREESLQKGFVAKHSFDDIVHVSAVMDECIRARGCSPVPIKPCLYRAKAARARSSLRNPYTTPPPAGTSLSSLSTAPRCRKACLKANCSAMNGARSPAQGKAARKDCLSRQTAAQFFWMKLAICHWRSNPACCAFCRKSR